MTPFDDFGNDPFEELVREFFGGSGSGAGRRVSRGGERFISNEVDERNIDYVEDDGYVYIMFELPGFDKDDVSVSIQSKELIVKAVKKESKCEEQGVQNYLFSKMSSGMIIRKSLPNFVDVKNFKHTMKNGILEVIFSKK